MKEKIGAMPPPQFTVPSLNDGTRSSHHPQAAKEPATLLQPRDEPVASTTDENVSVTDVVKSSSASGKQANLSTNRFPPKSTAIQSAIRNQHESADAIDENTVLEKTHGALPFDVSEVSDSALEKQTDIESELIEADNSDAQLSVCRKETLFLDVLGISLEFPEGVFLSVDQHGNSGILIHKNGKRIFLLIGSSASNSFLRKVFKAAGIRVNKKQLKDINEQLDEEAEDGVKKLLAHNRSAPVANGIELALGDEAGTIIRVTAAGVEDVSTDSFAVFKCNQNTLPMVKPAEKGNLGKLRSHLNLSPQHIILVIGFITYTLAHPKAPGSNYVNLVIRGEQGSGKTSLTNLILGLIDPTVAGIQSFPNKVLDLAIASQNSHVLGFDNMRNVRASMSDLLCMCSSGGALTSRALYTDNQMKVTYIHVALVINGIHDIVNQPDFAQRCITVETLPIPEEERRRIGDINKQLEEDLPEIFRGLLDLISGVFKYLPYAKVIHPERMIDVSHWFAAMELVDGVPQGTYQKYYSDSVKESQLDTLMGNTLAATIVEFTEELQDEGKDSWSGTPSELLEKLERVYTGSRYARDWPQNPISMSKRLNGLKASLLSQGVQVASTRGKKRIITITNLEYQLNDEPVSEPVYGDDDIAF